MPRALLIALAALAASAFAMPALAADIGVVFMHGKWGTNSSQSPIGPMIGAMQRAGHLVDAPEMPWSRERAYDKDVEGALAEIDAAVQRLKTKGAQRIVVGGHSLGANMAMAYGARREGLAGIIAVAPGHTPEQPGFRKAFEDDYARALKMLADGKGATKERFADTNQGRTAKVGATAQAYVSWMDPKGAAVMPISAAQLKPGVPFLWVIGREDGLVRQGEGYAYAKVPANPKNSYKVLNGGHLETPTLAAGEINAWLKGL